MKPSQHLTWIRLIFSNEAHVSKQWRKPRWKSLQDYFLKILFAPFPGYKVKDPCDYINRTQASKIIQGNNNRLHIAQIGAESHFEFINTQRIIQQMEHVNRPYRKDGWSLRYSFRLDTNNGCEIRHWYFNVMVIRVGACCSLGNMWCVRISGLQFVKEK